MRLARAAARRRLVRHLNGGSVDNSQWPQNHGAPGARGNQKLLMGPFGHGQLSGGLEYPGSDRIGLARRSGDPLVRMMTPGAPEKLTIDLWPTALTFEKGRRIAVHVTSSNARRFEVNPNTGEAPGAARLKPRVAVNTVYLDASRPSSCRWSIRTT